MKGRTSSTLLNFRILPELHRSTLMSAFAICWYSAITWRHAPQGEVMSGQMLPFWDPPMAMLLIGTPGYVEFAANIAVLSAQRPDGDAAFS